MNESVTAVCHIMVAADYMGLLGLSSRFLDMLVLALVRFSVVLSTCTSAYLIVSSVCTVVYNLCNPLDMQTHSCCQHITATPLNSILKNHQHIVTRIICGLHCLVFCGWSLCCYHHVCSRWHWPVWAANYSWWWLLTQTEKLPVKNKGKNLPHGFGSLNPSM